MGELQAFPHGDPANGGDIGMTLRDWFAGAVVGALLAGTVAKSIKAPPSELATLAYEMADAMIAARQNGGPQ